MEEVRSYSRFEECLMLLIAEFFSEEKDIEKFSEWFDKKITKTTTKLKKEKQYETCPYRSTDMGCDYCDYRDRDLKEEYEKELQEEMEQHEQRMFDLQCQNYDFDYGDVKY